MKQIYALVILLMVSGFSILEAQVCTFTGSEVDSVMYINPKPFDPDNSPDGGIKEEACIGEEYETQFVIYAPKTAPGIPVGLDSILIVDEGVTGLPEGLDDFANTSNKVFYPETADCLLIKGIPDASNSAGEYKLEIKVMLFLQGLGAIPYTLPDPTLTGEGEYILKLNDAGQCMTSSDDVENFKSKLQILSNPVTTDLKLLINSRSNQTAKIELISMFGQKISSDIHPITYGLNRIEINARSLNQGIYFIKYKDENSETTRRFQVVKP